MNNEPGAPDQRPNALALMRFFSVDVDPDMNISNYNTAIQVPELNDLWNREFILKILQLVCGFVCIGVYSEGLELLRDEVNAMMFPNVVFSSLAIITSVIILSLTLGCRMTDVLIRIFNVLGMLLYLSVGTQLLYEGVTRTRRTLGDGFQAQRTFLTITSVMSYFNSVFYGLDVYFSIKKAVDVEYENIKL